MDSKQIKNKSNLRTLGLSSVLCILAVTAAADIEYGTHIIGHALFMMMLGILSVIFMTCEKSVFVLDAAALLAIVFFASNGSLMLTLLGAVIILSSMLLAYAVRKKSAKTSAVLIVSFTVTIGYLTVMAVFYAAEGNSLEFSELFSKLNAAAASVKVALSDVIRKSVESLPEEMIAYYAKHEISQEMLLEASLKAMEEYVDWMQLLLPGFFCALVQLMGYIGVTSFEKAVRILRYDAVLPEVRWHLYPTQISCVLYILITAVYLIISLFGATASFAVIITNFWIALMPVMLACGFRSLLLRLKHPQLRRSMVFILILLAAGCFFMPNAIPTVCIFMLTFMGAQDVSLSRSAEAGDTHFKKQQ